MRSPCTWSTRLAANPPSSASLTAAADGGWIAPGALIVWEESAPIVPPAGLTPRDARRYGDTMISILTADT